ncbi:958_t:CDS:2 [Ambispora leptoticha]|uniref:958_t:CDS:1 n=1 Tax=Ambispora leptoticha TaxID=144679 RepID=A0A9N9G1A0_9GLOM|nr:958_t:CDS:2 [Ambispora leptoticha]
MDEGSKGLFFKGEAARKIVKGLRERAENNGPLSPNEFESFIDSYENPQTVYYCKSCGEKKKNEGTPLPGSAVGGYCQVCSNSRGGDEKSDDTLRNLKEKECPKCGYHRTDGRCPDCGRSNVIINPETGLCNSCGMKHFRLMIQQMIKEEGLKEGQIENFGSGNNRFSYMKEEKKIMQEITIPSAQILSVEKLPDKKLRKYTFFNTQTGIKDFFYSDKKVNHIPEIAGELDLSVNENHQEKFFQNFAQNIQKFEIPELIKFEKPLEEEVIRTKPKKTITKLAPWQIRKLREKSFS